MPGRSTTRGQAVDDPEYILRQNFNFPPGSSEPGDLSGRGRPLASPAWGTSAR